MSKKEQQTNSILLKECYRLVTKCGISRHDIKFNGKVLYVKGSLHGEAGSEGFVASRQNTSSVVSPSSITPCFSGSHGDSTSGPSRWLTISLLFFINARSLTNKFHHFQSYVYSSLPTVVAVTESWLFPLSMIRRYYPLATLHTAKIVPLEVGVYSFISSTFIYSQSDPDILAIKLNTPSPVILCCLQTSIFTWFRFIPLILSPFSIFFLCPSCSPRWF